MKGKNKAAVLGLALLGATSIQGCTELAMLVAADEIAQSNIVAARIQANSSGDSNARGPYWTHKPLFMYDRVTRTKPDRWASESGFLSIYDEGIQFIGNNGGWSSIPYENIIRVDSTNLLIEADWLDILTPTNKYRFDMWGVDIERIERYIESKSDSH